MALVWAEPFDQYGGNGALVANAGYSASGFSNVTGVGRTGTRAMTSNNTGWLTRSLDNAGVTTLGQGVAFNAQGALANSANNVGMMFGDSGGSTIRVVQMDDLGLGVYNRAGALVGRTAPNQLIIGSYVWYEAKCIGNTAGANTGSVEVRVQGVQKLVVNGIDIPLGFTSHSIGGFNFSVGIWDDYIVWDNTGANNTDFMGDRRLLVCYPNANGALQDFTPSAGNAFDRVNDAPPVDTSYIEGAAAGNISEFPKDAISIASTDIAAVVVIGRLFKTDAGVASARLGINSNASVNNSAELFPGTTGAFFRNIVERDPNGGIAWTKAAVDAASIRITRQQ